MSNEPLDKKANDASTLACCATCEHVTTVPELLVKSGMGNLCPPCAIKNKVNPYGESTKWLGYFGLFLVGLFWLIITDGDAVYIILNLFIAAIAFYPLLALHEFVHALATILVGGKVFAIQLGLGRVLFRKKVLGIWLTLNRFLIAGLCFSGIPTINLIRTRYFFIVAAAPFYHIVIFWLCVSRMDFSSIWTAVSIWPAILLPNSLLLFSCLYPFSSNLMGVGLGSDGLQMLRLLGRKLSPDDLHAQYYLGDIQSEIFSQNHEKALKRCEFAMSQYPENDYFQFTYASLLILTHDFKKAIELFERILPKLTNTPQDSVLRAYAYNNIAWSRLMVYERPEQLDIVTEYAKKALEIMPWTHHLRGTYAALLIEKGFYDEGVDEALAVADEMGDEATLYLTDNMATNLAVAARGLLSSGNKEEARACIAEAMEIAPDNYYLCNFIDADLYKL